MAEFHRRLGIGAFAVAFASSPAIAHAAIPSGNLVFNPGAETSPGTSDPNVVTAPVGWTTSAGFTAIRYGTGDFPSTAHATQLRAGLNFFAGGPTVAESTATQTIDVPVDVGPDVVVRRFGSGAADAPAHVIAYTPKVDVRPI